MCGKTTLNKLETSKFRQGDISINLVLPCAKYTMYSQHCSDHCTVRMRIVVTSMINSRPGYGVTQTILARLAITRKSCHWTKQPKILERLNYGHACLMTGIISRG